MIKEKAINKIARVSGNAVKSFFGLGLGYGGIMESEVVSPLNYRSSGSPFGNIGWNFGAANGYDVFFSYSGLNDVVTAYEKCAPVFSIINKQAYAFINGKTRFVDDKGKDFSNPYTEKLKNLFAKPNPHQNWKQFEAQLSIYCRLFGFCIILPVKPVGFQNEDASMLWIIPPYMCDITMSEKMFFNSSNVIEKIIIRYGQEVTSINPEDVIIIREITPGFNTPFIPDSPIKSLQQNISNLIGIYNSKGMLINYRGALGILSPERDPTGEIPLEPSEKEEIQNGLLRYGLKAGQWKFIVSNSAMKWQQIGVPYKDLMLTEWAEDDTMIVADVLNYPYKLLANANTATSISGLEAEAFKKQLYQDFVIPFAEMLYEQLSSAFNTQAHGFTLKKDYNHITVLQEDKINAGRSRFYLNQGCLIEWQNNVLTANDWRALNQLPPLPDGDQFYTQWVESGKLFGGKGRLPLTPTESMNDNPNQNN